MQTKLPTARWVIAVAIACGLILSQFPIQPVPPGSQSTALEWLSQPRPVAPFILTSATGDVTERAMSGQWQLLIFGFTHCPDLCPTTLAELADLQTALADDTVRVIFVSVDPQRDSPAQLAGYVQFFGTGILGITGDEPQLRRLAHSLGMDFRRKGSIDNPRISHSPTIALIGPNGYLRGRLRPGFDVNHAAREISNRMKNAS